METDKEYICTKESPWTPEKGEPAVHPDAEIIVDLDEACWYVCPHCKRKFLEQLDR